MNEDWGEDGSSFIHSFIGSSRQKNQNTTEITFQLAHTSPCKVNFRETFSKVRMISFY